MKEITEKNHGKRIYTGKWVMSKQHTAFREILVIAFVASTLVDHLAGIFDCDTT